MPTFCFDSPLLNKTCRRIKTYRHSRSEALVERNQTKHHRKLATTSANSSAAPRRLHQIFLGAGLKSSSSPTPWLFLNLNGGLSMARHQFIEQFVDCECFPFCPKILLHHGLKSVLVEPDRGKLMNLVVKDFRRVM